MKTSRLPLAALSLSLSILLAPAAAQPSAASTRQDPALLAELNRDIWSPFAEAWEDGNLDQYLALHAPEFIRVSGDSRAIRPLAEHADATRRAYAGRAEREEKEGISFRFVERIARNGLASERGIYEITRTDNDGNTERFYGKFHTIARKLDGKWRLVVDYDSDEGGTINQATYRTAAAPDDFKRF